MRYAGISFTCIFGLLAAMATGQESKPNFSGKWQLNAEKSQIHSGNVSAVKLLALPMAKPAMPKVSKSHSGITATRSWRWTSVMTSPPRPP